MKCSDSSKLIYLFNELNPGEKRKLQHHLNSCKKCQHAHELLQEYPGIVKAAFNPPEINPEVLTNRIVTAIIQKKTRQISILDQLIINLQFSPARLALCLISLFLVAFFALEYNRPPTLQEPMTASRSRHYSIGKVKLNGAFYGQLAKTFKENQSAISSGNLSFYDCIEVCKKSSEDDCSACLLLHAKN